VAVGTVTHPTAHASPRFLARVPPIVPRGYASRRSAPLNPHSDVERVNALREHLAFRSAQQEQAATHTHPVLGASAGLTVLATARYAIALHEGNDCHRAKALASDGLRDRRSSCGARHTWCAC